MLRVLGAPGTGRTTTALELVVDRVRNEGIAPVGCLVLTARRPAAAELLERITAGVAGTRAGPLRPPQRVEMEQFSRPPLARMMQLHAQLQARKFPNCRKLAETLEVSAKTIQRDIEFMRYQLGLPIEYDQLHFGFVYTEPVTSFPSIQVSEGEIVALFIAQKALQQYRDTPFEAPLKAASQTIGHGLKAKVPFP